ncbi:MAG: trypsin-like peptidase domain-containing protein [Sphingobacteriales bacterium]|nr:trypsin-like peptidase domain-containing protein [Sphingobacteriales bacterium]
MKRQLFFIVFTLFTLNLFSQSLGVERLAHAKKSIVRILIEGKPSGTGFIVSSAGQIITCWHVIDPAFIRDTLNRLMGLRKIEAEFSDGVTVELGIYN